MRDSFARARALTFLTQLPDQPDWFITRQLTSPADWEKAEAPVDGAIPEIRSFEESKIDPDKVVKIGERGPMDRFSILFSGMFGQPGPGETLKALVKINKDIGHDVCRNLTALLAQDPLYVERCIESIESFTQVAQKDSGYTFFFHTNEDAEKTKKLAPRERLRVVNTISAYFSRLYDVAESGQPLADGEAEELAAGISGILDETQLGSFLNHCCRLSQPADKNEGYFFMMGEPEKTCLPEAPTLVAHYWPEIRQASKNAEGVKLGSDYLMHRSWAARNAGLIINTKATSVSDVPVRREPIALLTA